MKQWDYRAEPLIGGPSEHESDLNFLGEEGWELVSVAVFHDGAVAYLRRDREVRKEAWARR